MGFSRMKNRRVHRRSSARRVRGLINRETEDSYAPRNGSQKLGGKPAHRKALLRNLMNALVHGRADRNHRFEAKECASTYHPRKAASSIHGAAFSPPDDKEATDKLFAR